MKRFSIFFLFLTLCAYSKASHFESSALTLQTLSSTVNNFNGFIDLPLQYRGEDTLEWNHSIFVEPDGGQPWYNGFNLLPGNLPPFQISPGIINNCTIRVFVNTFQLPFFYQKLKVGIRDNETQKVISSEYAYVYFTPWNTVEVWGTHDWELLKRVWDSPSGPVSPARVAVNLQEVPVSDLTDAEMANENTEIVYKSIPGLAYTIPMKAPTSGQKTNGNLFTGTVGGHIETLVMDNFGALITLDISDIRVAIMEKQSSGTDREMAFGFTDEAGDFSIAYSHESAVSDIEFYIKVEAVNEARTIMVRKRLGDARSSNHFKSSPFGHNFSVNNTASTGDIVVDNNLVKPQLLHWANRSRELIEDQMTTFSLPTDAGNRLDIMRSFVGSNQACFMPGGSQSQLISLVAILGTSAPMTFVGSSLGALNGIAPLVILAMTSSKDAVYMGSDRELFENTMYHEFGHYLMWHLQNESWADLLQASFASHSLKNNNPNPKLSWNEGFAHGFSAIVDAWSVRDDGEFGNHLASNYESRDISTNGSIHSPEAAIWTHKIGGLLTPNEQICTHGFLSEWSIGAAIYDLWDGSNNLELNNDPSLADAIVILPKNFNDDDLDNTEFSLEDLLQPLISHQGTGGFHSVFNNQEQFLLRDVVAYHKALVESVANCQAKGDLTKIMHQNGIRNLDMDIGSVAHPEHIASDFLNTDSLYFEKEVYWTNYKEKLSDMTARIKSISHETYTVSVSELPEQTSSFNLTPNIDPVGSLSDDLLVTGSTGTDGATLSIHGNHAEGWQDAGNAYGAVAGTLTPTPGNYSVSACGGMTLTANQGGTIQVGDETSTTADVTFGSGTTLILGGGAMAGSPETDPLYGEPVSKGKLIIHDNSTVTLEAGSKLLINRGAEIHLMGPNAVLKIQGNIEIADSALFTFEGDGMFYFDLPDYGGFYNVMLGDSGVIQFKGSGITDQAFYIEESTYIRPGGGDDSTTIIIEDCYGYIGGNGFIDVGTSALHMSNARLTSSPVGYAGLHLNGYYYYINNVEFEQGNPALALHSKYPSHLPLEISDASFSGGGSGIEIDPTVELTLNNGSFDNYSGNGISATQATLELNNCQFSNGDFGVFTSEGIASLIDCDFEGMSTTGYYCTIPTSNCDIEGGTSDGNAGYGYQVVGSSAILDMYEVVANNNGIGLGIDGGGTGAPRCSEFNDNTSAGIEASALGVVDIEHYAYNKVDNNPTAIQLDGAAPPMLDVGNNDLSGSTSGYAMEGTIFDAICECVYETDPETGLLVCTGYTMMRDNILASENTWNSTASAISSSDYDLTDVSGRCDYTLTDAISYSISSCASPTSSRTLSGSQTSNPIFGMGREIKRGKFVGMKFGPAVASLMELPQKVQRLEDWHELLMTDLEYPDAVEQKLIHLAYKEMKSAMARMSGFGEIDYNRGNNLLEIDPAAKLLLEVIDKQLGQEFGGRNLPFRSLLAADRAQLNTQLGRTEIAIQQFDEELLIAKGAWKEFLTCMSCQAEAKDDFLKAHVSTSEYFGRLVKCEKLRSTNPADAADSFGLTGQLEVTLFPNPSQGRIELEIEGLAQSWELKVYDLKGQLRYENEFSAPENERTVQELNLAELGSGMYLVRVRTGKEILTKRLVIQD